MPVDYQLAFDLAPVGLVLSRNRSMMDCNQHVCEMFGATREQLTGQSPRHALRTVALRSPTGVSRRAAEHRANRDCRGEV